MNRTAISIVKRKKKTYLNKFIAYCRSIIALTLLRIKCTNKYFFSSLISKKNITLIYCRWFIYFRLVLFVCFQPVGIYPKKYEWAAHLHSSHLNGDCSLWIRSATLEFDDGVWECQVTASDFTAQDALTSKPVRLVVRGKCDISAN